MLSQSLVGWNGKRSDAFNEIENAHTLVGGIDRGRRYATRQTNFTCATLLSSQFQGFCRDLHSECVDQIVAMLPVQTQRFIQAEFTWNRSLSKGNPHPGAIGSDFNRLGIDLWIEVYALDARNERRRELLQEFMDWRNAIAHQDFASVAPGGNPTLHLATVKGWRSAVGALARAFDQALFHDLTNVLGVAPW